MKGCLKILKNPINKPAAAIKKKKKRSASMTMRQVMKKKVGRPKIIKRPASMVKSATRMAVFRKQRSNVENVKAHERKKVENVRARARQAARSEQRQVENVKARARQAARSGLPYQSLHSRLAEVADAAHAAEVRSKEARDQAAGAREVAGEAKEEAVYARLVVEEVRSDARTMAEENSKRITSLEKQVEAGAETLRETVALTKKNEERLNTDDRKRGDFTPKSIRTHGF
jgi:hypothetical protein